MLLLCHIWWLSWSLLLLYWRLDVSLRPLPGYMVGTWHCLTISFSVPHNIRFCSAVHIKTFCNKGLFKQNNLADLFLNIPQSTVTSQYLQFTYILISFDIDSLIICVLSLWMSRYIVYHVMLTVLRWTRWFYLMVPHCTYRVRYHMTWNTCPIMPVRRR